MNQSDEKTVAFIIAGLQSTRFPAKQFRKLGSKTLLSWTVTQVQQSEQIDEIVLVTTADQANRPLIDFARQNSIRCFWYEGEEHHLTTRLCEAAKKFEAEICVLINGDYPLIDTESIDQLIIRLQQNPEMDCITIPPQNAKSHCLLQGVSIARKKAWDKAEEISDSPELKAHQFPIINQRPDLFQSLSCEIDSSLYGEDHKLSIDTWADYSFYIEVYSHLLEKKKDFSLKNVVSILLEKPELKDINKHVYQRKLIEYIPNILYISFSQELSGFGMSFSPQFNIETALDIIERRGWPVHFLTNDMGLQSELSLKGIKYTIVENVSVLPDFFKSHPPAHLIIDTSDAQFPQPVIKDLLSYAISLIIIGEYSGSIEENMIKLPSWHEVFDSNHEDNNFSSIITDFIKSHI